MPAQLVTSLWVFGHFAHLPVCRVKNFQSKALKETPCFLFLIHCVNVDGFAHMYMYSLIYCICVTVKCYDQASDCLENVKLESL